jgi:GGDEF domain-containing protein
MTQPARSFHLDHATGLLNRRTFTTRFHEEMGDDRPVGVIVLTLDDESRLAEAVLRMASLARASHSTGRVGESRLAWLLPDADGPDVLDAVDELRSEIAGAQVRASIGYLTVM